MKVVCSICGGTLLVESGGKMAVCTGCSVGYSIERVREMVGMHNHEPPVERVSAPEKKNNVGKERKVPQEKRDEAKLWEEVTIEPVRIRIRAVVGSGFQTRTLSGVVESGTFDLGSDLYVNDDKNKVCCPYKMTCKDVQIATAEKEMQVMITFNGPQVKHLKDAKYLTAPAALSGSIEEEVYFAEILKNHFREYTVKRNVKISRKMPAVPASFVLYKKERPVLAIILCSSRVYNYDKIENTMEACKQQKIPVQRYFTEFENDKEYVIKRIKKEL